MLKRHQRGWRVLAGRRCGWRGCPMMTGRGTTQAGASCSIRARLATGAVGCPVDWTDGSTMHVRLGGRSH